MDILGLLNVLSIVLLGTILVVLYGTVFGYRFREKKLPAVIFSSVIVVAAIVVNVVIKDPVDAYDATSFIAFPLYFISYFYLVPIKKKTFIFTNLAVVSAMDYVQYIVEGYLDKSTASILIDLVVYCIIYLVVLVIIFLLYEITGVSVSEGYLDNLPVMIYISFFFLEISSFYYGNYTADSTNYFRIVSVTLNTITVGLVAASIVYMIYSYTKLSIRQKESEMNLEIQHNHYEELARSNEEVRKFRHDIKNNLYALNVYINNNRYDEAKEYIDDLTGKLDATKAKFNTGNYIADALITEKAKYAEENGITVSFFGAIPSCGIKNSDLCTILFNSLDNAIRECMEIAPCEMKIRSSWTKNSAVITVSNPCRQNVEIRNNTIKTTKSDKKNHGFGISNVRKVAEEYGGYVDLSCEDNIFTIEIGFELNFEEGSK